MQARRRVPLFAAGHPNDHVDPADPGAVRRSGDAGQGQVLARNVDQRAILLEEEVVVTKDGCEIITRFPSEKLLVAGTHYFTAGGELPTTRETQSALNNPGALERIKG